MTSNINYSQEERKKYTFMSPSNSKMMSKRVTVNLLSNKSIINLSNRSTNNVSSNLNNNHLVYQSFNRNGYTGIVDPSLSGNNNILIINNSEKDSQHLIDISPKKQKRIAIYKNSKNYKLEQMQNPNMTNNDNNNKINSFSKTLQTNSNSIVSNENPSNKNYSKWNNVGFREIKCKKNNGVLSYEINTTKNINVYKNNQEFSSSTGQNVINNDNLRRSNNTNISTNSQRNSSLFYKQNTNPVLSNRENRILKFKNSYRNKNQNEVPKTYGQDSNKVKTNDNPNNNGISKNKVIINNLKSPKTNRNNLSNPYFQNVNLNSDYKRKTETKKPNNALNNDFISKRKNIYKNTTEKDNNKDKDKEKISNSNNSNSLTIRQYYKNVTQKQKSFPINTNESNNLNYLRNKNAFNKNKLNRPNEEYIKNVCKIQSLWKGKYVRKLMSYYWNLSNFKDILESVITNHSKKKFFNKIKLTENKKDISYDRKIDDYSKIKKDFEELKRNSTKKEKEYDKLLEKYNSIVKKFDELKKKNNENEKIINKYNIKINKDKDNISKVNDIYNNNNFQINNNNKKLKKFDDIKQEKKEELNIISNYNQDNSIKLRAPRPKKQEESDKRKSVIENGTQLDWKEYIEDLSNLEIKKNEQFLINKKDLHNQGNRNKLIPTYEIINYNLTLVTHNKVENPKILKICKNKPFSLLNNSIKNNKNSTIIFDNESLIKSNNYESITYLSTKENKEYNKLNLSPENQNNLNIEIKGIESLKTSSKEYIIEQQKNDMAIFGGEKQNMFNKEFLFKKNDISMNIISQKEAQKETDKNINKNEDIKENDEDFDNYANYENEKDDKGKKVNKNIEIFENERFCLTNGDISNKKNLRNNSENLIIDNKENNYLLNRDKNSELIICDNDKLNIEGKRANKCDNFTEISNEINIMEPDNHYELIFSPTNIKKENRENENNKKVEFENEINIENSAKNENEIENENKTILRKKQQFEIINKIENNIPGIIINSTENRNSKNVNYNLVNEIEKGDALEINPFEMRRTQNNTDNIFISNENKIEFLNNKESIYSDKAKKNMMRIILPIKLKSIIRETVKKMAYKYLIHNLKEMKKN